MDLRTAFRATYNLNRDKDIITMIESAITVAMLVNPTKLKKRRTNILKTLFGHNSKTSQDSSDDDNDLWSDDNDEAKKADEDVKISYQESGGKFEIKNGNNNKGFVGRFKVENDDNTRGFEKRTVREFEIKNDDTTRVGFKNDNTTRFEIKNDDTTRLGFKKTMEEKFGGKFEIKKAVVGNSRKGEVRKRKLGDDYKYDEASEKKSKRTIIGSTAEIQQAKKRTIGSTAEIPQAKKRTNGSTAEISRANDNLCGDGQKKVVKKGNVRQRLDTKMRHLKKHH